MQGVSNCLGLFQVIMANPVNDSWNNVVFRPKDHLGGGFIFLFSPLLGDMI